MSSDADLRAYMPAISNPVNVAISNLHHHKDSSSHERTDGKEYESGTHSSSQQTFPLQT